MKWGATILLVVMVIFFNQIIVQLLNEIIQVAKIIWDCFKSEDYFKIVFSLFNYSFSSYFIMFVIGIIPTTILSDRLKKNRIFEKVGIKNLDKGVKDLTIKKEHEITSNNGTLIGYTQSKKPVYCCDTAKHVLVCGTTGSGKTVALSNFIKQAILKDYGLLVIDGKGDTGDGSILEITKNFCNAHHKKLYIIDMNSISNSAKYNPFSGANETIIKDMLVNMSDWSEEHYKANAERYIQRVIKLMISLNELLTFENIIDCLQTDTFFELSLKAVEQGFIDKTEQLKIGELIKRSGKIAESAVARFATIQESEVGGIFSTDKAGIDIYKAVQENAVIIFILNPLTYPETSKLLGRLALIDCKKAISKMFNQNENRSFFIFDELNVYASTVLTDIINKSRSANITCFPAIQSLADLEQAVNENFKNQIIENCNNYLILRQNSFKSAEEWAKTIGTVEKMKMTYKLSDGEDNGQGSARKTREFITHPDEIKSQKTGEAIFLSRDDNIFQRIRINKPF